MSDNENECEEVRIPSPEGSLADNPFKNTPTQSLVETIGQCLAGKGVSNDVCTQAYNEAHIRGLRSACKKKPPLIS
jgi:uncharacterized protein YgiB involved in biofilm formation